MIEWISTPEPSKAMYNEWLEYKQSTDIAEIVQGSFDIQHKYILTNCLGIFRVLKDHNIWEQYVCCNLQNTYEFVVPYSLVLVVDESVDMLEWIKSHKLEQQKIK